MLDQITSWLATLLVDAFKNMLIGSASTVALLLIVLLVATALGVGSLCLLRRLKRFQPPKHFEP